MTLKELVMKVEFDNLRPYLEKFEPEHLDNIYAFREAYDILRRMTPAKNGQHEIHVSWSGGEMEGEKKWISVHPMHEVSWEEDLAADVVVADDIHLTDEELAMHCLWEITYWGFSPEEQLETFERKFNYHKPVNKYEVALDKLEESIWKHQTPRRLRCRGEKASGSIKLHGGFVAEERTENGTPPCKALVTCSTSGRTAPSGNGNTVRTNERNI